MIRNLRDLGGITAADGRKIKKGIYYRSAKLDSLDADDIKWLRKANIVRIFDLRTSGEVANAPDVPVLGIVDNNYYLQDEYSPEQKDLRHLRERIAQAKDDDEKLKYVPDMVNIYKDMIKSDYSRERFCDLIRNLVRFKGGSTLFHCTSGKDRTGMVAAMLCSVLGVSRDDIYEDYLLSLEHSRWESAMIREKYIAQGFSEKLADGMTNGFYKLDRSYLDAFFYEISI